MPLPDKTQILLLLLTACLCLGNSTYGYGQDLRKTNHNHLLGNICVNGLVGGLGAVINKKSGQRTGKVFLKGFGQGCLGGSMQYLGKKMVYQVNRRENLGWVWPARIVNAAGSSITMNAAANRNFWESWHLNLWAFRFEYDLTDRRFRARVTTSGLISLYHIGRRGKFRLFPSLATGTLLFEGNDGFQAAGGLSGAGIAWGATIGFPSSWRTNGTYYEWMAHEFAHTLQFDNFNFSNAYLNKSAESLLRSSGLYRTMEKFLLLDLNGPVFYLTYLTEGGQAWECRTFERGADLYGRKRLHSPCN